MFPSAIIKTPNPLYEYERRRIRWLGENRDLKRYTFGVWGVAALAALFLASLAYSASSQSLQSTNFFYFPGVWALWTFATLLGWVLPFYYMAAAMRSMAREFASGQWDVLRLTTLGEENIIKAKYAIIQSRIWRFMVVLAVVQMLSVVLTISSEWQYIPQFRILSSIIFLIIFTIVEAFLSALWRMKMFAALGLAVGARVKDQTYAYLTIFVVIITIIIGENIAAGLIAFIGNMAVNLFSPPGFLRNYLVWNIFLSTLSGFVIRYISYRIFQRIGLNNALRGAFTAGN